MFKHYSAHLTVFNLKAREDFSDYYLSLAYSVPVSKRDLSKQQELLGDIETCVNAVQQTHVGVLAMD